MGGRIPNRLATVPLKLSATQLIHTYLDRLVATGLYGKNKAEAGSLLLARGIEQAIAAGLIERAR